MQLVAQDVRERVLKMLRRKGLMEEETHESNEEEKVDDALEACRNVASSPGRFERIRTETVGKVKTTSDF